MLYSRNTNKSGNIIKRTNTLLHKNISLTLYSRKGWSLCGVWEMGEETYTQREDFFFPYLLPEPGAPTLALPCKLVRDASDRPRVPRSSAILGILFKSDRMVFITWSPSRYTHVVPDCPDVPSSSCLLIKMWQLAKAHGVTGNEPKIHVICYITFDHLTVCKQMTDV